HVTLAERLVDRFFYRESAEHALKAMELDEGLSSAYAVFAINALRSGWEKKGREVLDEAWARDKFNVWIKNTRTLMEHIDENFTTSENDGLVIRMRSDEEPWLMPFLRPLLTGTRTTLERDYQIAMLRPLTVEDFSDHAYFSARSIGLPGLAASGVCFGHLVTLTTPHAIPGNWGAVAVHEFAHVATLQKAKHRIPRWFGEGLSVLEEGRTESRWRRSEPLLVSSEFHGGGFRSIEDLQGAFTNPRWRGEILVGYVQSGLICEWIVETKGLGSIRKMLDAYSRGQTTLQVLKEVLGKSAGQFDKEFLEWMSARVADAGIGPSFQQRHIDYLRERTVVRPGDVRAWVWLAAAYLASGRKADAELTLGKAEKIDEDNPDLLAIRGLMEMADGLVSSAQESLRGAIAGDTIWAWRSRLLLAKTLREQGKNEEALKLYLEATTMAPSGISSPVGGRSPWVELATIQKDLGFNDDAIESLRSQALHNRDDAGSRLLVAESLAEKSDWEGVVDVAWDLPFIDPYNDKGHHLLSQGYIGIEAWGKAKRELKTRLSASSPELGEIYPDLAWVLWKLGEDDEARKMARRALRLAPAAVRPRQVLDALGNDDPKGDGGR
ncbi:MAG: tetratricopeptide repeat protein, partial [Planctomycetes bacterium]|nr:tetratricopeptide repeat protein [Planctomycetota bacterium]